MPGKKVYYTDPYLTELKTSVTSSKTDERGTWYSFQETLFYPQGGGQSSDKGWINSSNIVDVQSSEGEVWHLVNSPLSDAVAMRLDWSHRYTNMQQHTGQHILSACFKKYHNLDTLSVHLGVEITMIELDTPAIEESILDKTEISANQLIRESLTVESKFVERSNLDEFNLRRSLKTEDERVRLVKIGDMDCIGCGGTHVRSTSEVGLIKIIGVEKIRGHARIKTKIGLPAYHYFQSLHQTLQHVSTKLTTSIEDLTDKIDFMTSEKKDLINEKKRITELWLAEYANNLDDRGNSGCFVFRDLNKDHLKILSEHYLVKNQLPCLFLSKQSGKIHFYIRFPEEFVKSARDFVQEFQSKYFLKGGGGKDFAVGQIDAKNMDRFSEERMFQSFNEFINERSDK
jgi:Ser-tRNA(Ala) deacylase AlaX